MRYWPLLLALLAGCNLADADELLFGQPVGSGVVSIPFDATQSPGCMQWDGTTIDSTGANCGAAAAVTPTPTVTVTVTPTAQACGANEAVGALSNQFGATCIPISTPQATRTPFPTFSPQSTQTPWACGAGAVAIGMAAAAPTCAILPTPDGSGAGAPVAGNYIDVTGSTVDFDPTEIGAVVPNEVTWGATAIGAVDWKFQTNASTSNSPMIQFGSGSMTLTNIANDSTLAVSIPGDLTVGAGISGYLKTPATIGNATASSGTLAYNLSGANDPSIVGEDAQVRLAATGNPKFAVDDADIANGGTPDFYIQNSCSAGPACAVNFQWANSASSNMTLLAGSSSGGISLGDSGTTALVVATNGTGDSEVVLPANSVQLAASGQEVTGILPKANGGVGGITSCGTLGTDSSGLATCVPTPAAGWTPVPTATPTVGLNKFLAGPTAGGATPGVADYRSIVIADLPTSVTALGATIGGDELTNPFTIPAGTQVDFGQDASMAPLDLPRHTDCSTVTTESRVCWDRDTDVLGIGNGTINHQVCMRGQGCYLGATPTPTPSSTAAAATPTVTVTLTPSATPSLSPTPQLTASPTPTTLATPAGGKVGAYAFHGNCRTIQISNVSNSGTAWCGHNLCQTTSSDVAIVAPTRPVAIFDPQFFPQVDAPWNAEYLLTFQRTVLASCTAATDGGSKAGTCLWTRPATSPRCTLRGTALPYETGCYAGGSGVTYDNTPMIVYPGEGYQGLLMRFGTWSTGAVWNLSWRECEIGGPP